MTTRFFGGLNVPSQQLRNKSTTGGPVKPSRLNVATLSGRFHIHRLLFASELRLTPAFRSHSLMLRDFSFRGAWFRATWSQDLWSREPFPRSTATFAAQRCGFCAHRKPG